MRVRVTGLAITLVFLFISPLLGETQGDSITVHSKVSDGEIRTWLSSGDARLLAWGAYFARESTDDVTVTLMLRLVAKWTPPPENDYSLKRARMDALSEVLDTLILRNEKVSPESLAGIAASFPAQATILAARLPIAEASPMLEKWYSDGDAADNSRLARIAAMLLAKAPPDGFAASVLEMSEEELSIFVRDDGAMTGGGVGGGGCSDGGSGLPIKDWPPLFRYELEENRRQTKDHPAKDPVVVSSGGDQIAYRRIPANEGGGSCSWVRPLTKETRQHLLLEMLGVDEKALPWKLRESFSIQWKNDAQYLSDLAKEITAEEARFHETGMALYAKKYLTKSESELVRPKLIVTVSDDRKAGSAPLPGFTASDSRTVISFAAR